MRIARQNPGIEHDTLTGKLSFWQGQVLVTTWTDTTLFDQEAFSDLNVTHS